MKLEDFYKKLDGSRRSIDDEFNREIFGLLDNNEFSSIDELNSAAERVVQNYNDMPRYELAGLSPNELSSVLYEPLDPGSVIRLKNNIRDETLDGIGFFCLVEACLRLIKRDGFIKLTKAGFLPQKVLLELSELRLVPFWPVDEGHFKLRREYDSPVMSTLHVIIVVGRLVRKAHGKLMLTKNGEKLMAPDCRYQLFRLVLDTYTKKFDWAYNDGYPDFWLCRDAFGFSLYLVASFAESETDKEFYAAKFLKAFPMSLEEFQSEPFGSPERSLVHCYEVRTFTRFLEWFNFVKVRSRNESDPHDFSLVRKTEVFDDVFEVVRSRH